MQPAFKPRHLSIFEISKGLGKGRFGRVYLAREREHGFICALKVLYKAELHSGNIDLQVREVIEIQSKLAHPNIIKLYGHFHDCKRIFLILELNLLGEVYRHLRKEKRLSEWKSARYIAQVVSALRHLHRKHIIHRDLIPENIMIGTYGEIKVAGFGSSIHSPDGRETLLCGTLDYLPPEMLRTESEPSCDEKVDLSALGGLIYEFLVGEAPFDDDAIRPGGELLGQISKSHPSSAPMLKTSFTK